MPRHLAEVSASNGIGSGRQSEESPGLRVQPGSNATTGNNTVPTTNAATTRTKTTTTVSGGRPNDTSGVDEAIQDSNGALPSIFPDYVEM